MYPYALSLSSDKPNEYTWLNECLNVLLFFLSHSLLFLCFKNPNLFFKLISFLLFSTLGKLYLFSNLFFYSNLTFQTSTEIHKLYSLSQAHLKLGWWENAKCNVVKYFMNWSFNLVFYERQFIREGNQGKYSASVPLLNIVSLYFYLNKYVLFSHSAVSESLWPNQLQQPGLPIHHQLRESTQIHLHWVSDAIQPSHPLSSPSPPALNLSQHQGLFKWVSSLHQVTKNWSFSINISPSNKHSGLICFRMDCLDLLVVQGTLKSLFQHHNSKTLILRCSAFFIVQLSYPYMTTGKTIALTRWTFVQFSSVQSLSRVQLFATPWIAARQAFLSITNSRSSLRLTSIESVIPSSHLILCRPLLLLPPIPPSVRVFSNESTLCMRWPK